MKQLYGVIGCPVSHSLSPVMHKAAYEELSINADYHAFHVEEKDLKEAVNGIRALGIRGINVTIPHKVSIIPYLDEIDPLAEEIGAVNTVVNVEGRLIGYNTDGEGYVHGLLPVLTKDFAEMRVLIIGAGGAARGVSLTLAKYGIREMCITNRTESKGRHLADDCSRLTEAAVLSLGRAQAELPGFDLIINTTSIGMAPDIDRMPLSLETLSQGAIVSDLIYTPAKTRWLQEAENKGAIIQNGLDMFVNQGALAFEKWTGKSAPKEIMKAKVLEKLGGNSC
ncbi:shikimate dehydrogenase [Salipaludibacillus agaradhaerens]|uniref:Shikimate dehydrogenase (NADP(+)) n=1 Tax=Salipaludibacillus agaradhaerens TaxID=76935 RepID=A0A9Q4B1X6_SALAG|nr:shikimate dehydrogenase [Salipaludibacillus agaradhaerens]MCR6096817.1 shikimate dehydrogenase [Salipaludibacillus agaradhaerens]MCR6113624.1 shikimate dehydrogenase [Salipaludibacillus agaradhaerens]